MSHRDTVIEARDTIDATLSDLESEIENLEGVLEEESDGTLSEDDLSEIKKLVAHLKGAQDNVKELATLEDNGDDEDAGEETEEGEDEEEETD